MGSRWAGEVPSSEGSPAPRVRSPGHECPSRSRNAGRQGREQALAPGRHGGGTTLPGKLLWKLDPGVIDELAQRLPHGAAVVSATNGKTTTTAMAAEILESGRTLAWNSSGANLVSGVASTLLAERGAELGLLEVDEGALPEVVRRVRPRAVLLGNLFRDQLDRYGELEHVAERWRGATGELPADTALIVNGDDPQVGDLARERAGAVAFGIDDPRQAREGAPARGRLALLRPLRSAVRVRRRVRRPPRGLPLPGMRSRAARAPGGGTQIELDGLRGTSFDLVTPAGTTRVRLPLPGLYNVYNALGAAALAQALGASLEEIRDGLERFAAAFGRFERIAAGNKSILLLLIKNPAGPTRSCGRSNGGTPSLPCSR